MPKVVYEPAAFGGSTLSLEMLKERTRRSKPWGRNWKAGAIDSTRRSRNSVKIDNLDTGRAGLLSQLKQRARSSPPTGASQSG